MSGRTAVLLILVAGPFDDARGVRHAVGKDRRGPLADGERTPTAPPPP